MSRASSANWQEPPSMKLRISGTLGHGSLVGVLDQPCGYCQEVNLRQGLCDASKGTVLCLVFVYLPASQRTA